MRYRVISGLLAILPACAVAAGSQVVSSVGQTSIVQDGRSRPAHPGMTIEGGYSAVAAGDAYLQLRTEDGAMIAVAEGSEVRIAKPAERLVELVRGGLTLFPATNVWTVEAAPNQVRASGYLRLRLCDAGCTEAAGLYGKTTTGEAVVEYKGGRSVVRSRSFHAPPDGARPQILVRDVALLDTDSRLELAARAKADLATRIKSGLDDFRAGRYDQARETFAAAQEAAPGEPLLAYYLGLIAMEQQHHDEALRQLQRYSRDDPEAARQRGVGELVTLLTANHLQEEVAQAIKQEQTVSTVPPEPNSIAVQPFTNRSDPAYAPLAKGIAAMIISDLSKVPGLKVLEREKVQKILDEINLTSSGLVDNETVLRAGRLMRAERIVVGSFGVQ